MKRKCVRGKRMFAAALAGVMMFAGIGMWEPAGVKAEERTVSEVREMPKNPVHHCTKENDGSDTTDWSYVYFGSYPQTEVTGNVLTAAITGASYDANGDAWVNGTKYRRVKKSDANYSISSSGYFPWSGEDDYHYFKWERIKWRVLNVNGGTMFVVAVKGLDCKDYNEEYTSVTWENCTLRNWLNNDFYGTAFSSDEQGAVVPQTVVNEDNPYYNIEGGNDTTDKVYLLSLSEVMNPDYGFCEDYNMNSMSWGVKASDYAYARGVMVDTFTEYVGNCWWWLRSPGYRIYNAAYVESSGSVYKMGSDVNIGDYACVPALHIDLSSDLWSIADDEIGGENRPGGSLDSGSGVSPGNQTGSGGNSNLGVSQNTPKESPLKGKITAKSKAFTVKWKKQTDVSGYQIQYSTSKKFKKGTKIKTVKKPNAAKTTIKKLKAGKKYYVRIRTYKTVGGTNCYSAWSKSKSVKTKA